MHRWGSYLFATQTGHLETVFVAPAGKTDHDHVVLLSLRRHAHRLDADQFHIRVVLERVKNAGRVAAAADAGHHGTGQPADLFQALCARFPADDRLEIADHHGKGVRADDAADDVVRAL